MAAITDPLFLAVQGTSANTLRATLMRMCNANSEVRKTAEAFLLVDLSSVPSSQPSPFRSSSNKRKADEIAGAGLVPRYDTCDNCGLEFDVSTNNANRCVWHEGEKLQDMENPVWDDFEEARSGDPAQYVDDPDYADGFRWTCCGEIGDDMGCVKGKHQGKRPVPQIVLSDDEDEEEDDHPAKHQKMDSGSTNGPPLHQQLIQSSPHPPRTPQRAAPHLAPVIVELSDSTDEEASDEDDEEEDHQEDDDEEKDPFYYHTCRVCGKEYYDDQSGSMARDCLSHDEDLTIKENCPLSMEEKEMLDPEVSPEWFYWPCCGEDADSEGCREDYHAPNRGMGY